MIELQSVTKRFPGTLAVDRVDLSIAAGEFLTLLGPSGCGKTTILRMISGFETPDSGRVMLADKEVTDVPPYRRDVNQVFQSYALFPHLSVAQNIEFGLKMKRIARPERRARVSEAIELVALSGLERRKPSQLSGGQKQRVALARAIVNRPKVLLLDEPLAALDAKLRRAMQIELKHLQRRLGITFVFVTHDQEEALTMSDRIAVMNAGRIEQLAGASDVYHRPASAFVASFIGQTNLLEGDLIARDGPIARVRIDDAISLQVNLDHQPCDGNRLLLSVRPEKLSIGREAKDGFAAQIVERIFRGEISQLVLRCATGRELHAIVTETGSSRDRIDPGTQVFCTIHPDDVVVVNVTS